ncbi:flagellin N-terminal helical domain-containing protein [Anaerocolumna xylanovorans]|uniref:Flagellin n=1 Tax=Anaerocolumna xylanovorans DSM 12503 TaxID=1121345 RepID=A0A1M7YMX4_9FIRM|nr:flagellin [Anaerocolumna xylanovorans]SHO53896.1 flagellin [Anaerocolumna xylanovorans DSM 12503]
MRINHNISALKANNQLVKTNKNLDKSLEKLSSGFRINKAADDAAGLAISQKMKTQIAGLDQASRNASDGISIIQTAEGALNEVNSMLGRMRELSVQAANGTNTVDDRKSIQAEIDQLRQEIQRISDTTEFNTKTLLDGSIDRQSFTSNPNAKLVSVSDTVPSKDYKIEISTPASKAAINSTTSPATTAITDASFYSSASPSTQTPAGTVNINGNEVKIESGDSFEVVYEKIRDVCDSANIECAKVNDPSPATTSHLEFSTKEYGSDKYIKINCSNSALSTALGLTSVATGTKFSGTDAVVKTPLTSVAGSNFSSTATASAKGNFVTITDSNGFEMVFDTQNITGSNVSISATVLDSGPMKLQIGANESQTMEVRLPKVDPDTLGIRMVNICTQEGAEAAISTFETANNMVSAIRAKLGAYQNRLEHSISNLDTTSENMTEALSRIEDVDMAKEMATYTQLNVLAQAGTSMLSQANQRPQTVLTLLQS